MTGNAQRLDAAQEVSKANITNSTALHYSRCYLMRWHRISCWSFRDPSNQNRISFGCIKEGRPGWMWFNTTVSGNAQRLDAARKKSLKQI